MATAFSQFETIIRENLGDSVINLEMRAVDDIALSMIDNFQPLGKGGQATTSPGWEARRKLKLSRGGMVTGGQWDGNVVTGMGTSDVLPVSQDASAKAPDPMKVPLTQYQTIRATLKRILGNVTVNMQQVLADIIGDEIEEVAMGHIEDAVFQVRRNLTGWFYSDGTGQLAQVKTAVTVDTTAGGAGVSVKLGTYNRFIKGQRYIFYSTTSWPTTTTRKGGIARCVNIDDIAETVFFEMEAGESSTSLVAGDIIVLHDTVTSGTSGVSLVPAGIEKFFQTADTSWYGVSLANFPELQAFVEGSETALVEPEPERFASLYDKILDSGKEPPTLFVSERALQTQYAILEKKGFAQYVVPGSMPTANGGVSGAMFSHGNIIVPWEVSSMIRPGTVWGAAPDTIHKFQPSGSSTIRWWNSSGSASGVASIFVPVMDGAQQTELMQAPFETHIEFLPVDPKRNFRRIGFTTQKTA